MEHSDSLAKIAQAMVQVQSKIKIAVKNNTAEVGKFRYDYADLQTVWDACREPLREAGIVVIQAPSEANDGHVGLTTMLLHSSGEYIKEKVTVRCPKDDPQGAGSAITYLRRYALCSFVGIIADKDDDGAEASKPQPVSFNKNFTPPAPSKPPGSPAVRF